MFFIFSDLLSEVIGGNINAVSIASQTTSYHLHSQCCQNILYLKYYTLFWQTLRIMLYLYFISVKYFKNTLLWDKIV